MYVHNPHIIGGYLMKNKSESVENLREWVLKALEDTVHGLADIR